MNIDALEGRALDGAVALAVMGWKSWHGTRKDLKTGEPVHHLGIENPDGLWWELELRGKDAAVAGPAWWVDQVNVPRFSEDLRLARLVFERVRAGGHPVDEPKGAAPPAALCRSALKALATN